MVLCPELTILQFSECRGGGSDNNISVETQSCMRLKRNMKLNHIPTSTWEIDGRRSHEVLGRLKVKWISLFWNVGDVIFFSDYLILLSSLRPFAPSCFFFVYMLVQFCDDDFRIKSKHALSF